jgi:hypothetical protein
VLEPSGVGSIPTHSRHFSRGDMLRWFLIALLLSASALPAAAVEVVPPVREPRIERSAPESGSGRNPRLAMGASLLFPGLGQLYNEEGLKTLLILGWEGYYLSIVLREGQRADLYRRHAAALDEGGTWNGMGYSELRDRFHAHEKRQTDYVWYTGALVLASILDAYVFANLHGFETDNIRGRRAAVLPLLDPAERSIGLQFRLSY